MLVVGLLFLLSNYTMGFYIQPEYSLQVDYDELADKISNMLSEDKVKEVKTLLDDEQIDITLEDLTTLKELLFDTPSIDTNVHESEFDWGEEHDEDL